MAYHYFQAGDRPLVEQAQKTTGASVCDYKLCRSEVCDTELVFKVTTCTQEDTNKLVAEVDRIKGLLN